MKFKFKTALEILLILIIAGSLFFYKDQLYERFAGRPKTPSGSAVENFVSALPTVTAVGENIQGIIVPHHLLVESFLDAFYSKIAAQNSYDKIIILSPNHFGYGFSYIQTTTEIKEDQFNFDQQAIEKLYAQGVVKNEPKYFGYEHGVFAEEKFINKYFPKAQVIPIIIKEETPQAKLDLLANQLTDLIQSNQENGLKTLVIASLDFSHYSKEQAAIENDQNSVEWLSNIKKTQDLMAGALALQPSHDQTEKEAVGIDSPETLYVMTKLMKNFNTTNFSLWKRTSSIALIPTTKPANNTSHLFGFFQ